MKKSILFASLVLPVTFLVGCVAESAEDVADADSGQVDTRIDALGSTQNGVKFTWTKVGDPDYADQLAACSPTKLFALNSDKALYKSTNGGVSWTYMATMPSNVNSIACNGDGGLDRFTTTHELWRSINDGASFSKQTGTFTAIHDINSGAMGMNGGAIYKYAPSIGSYTVTLLQNTCCAETVTGATWYDGNINALSRSIALNGDNTMWFTNGTVSSSTTWTKINGIDKNFDEISAGSPTVFFALTDVTSLPSTGRDLYRLNITEQNCTNGVDDDRDFVADSADPDCN